MQRKVCLLGVPMDLGGAHRGVDMGPSALRIAGLGKSLVRLGLSYEDLGNVAVREVETLEDLNDRARFVADIAAILEDDGIWVLEQSYLPLMLETNAFDTICHEHLEYYALEQIKHLMEGNGLRIQTLATN